MNSHRPTDEHLIFTSAGVATAALALLWLLSKVFGLGMYSGVMVFGGMALVLGLAILSWRFGGKRPFTRLSAVWPLLLALLWMCWWPALDYWAVKEVPSFDRADYVRPWWDTPPAKWGGLILVVVVGYSARMFLRRLSARAFGGRDRNRRISRPSMDAEAEPNA